VVCLEQKMKFGKSTDSTNMTKFQVDDVVYFTKYKHGYVWKGSIKDSKTFFGLTWYKVLCTEGYGTIIWVPEWRIVSTLDK